MRMEEPTLSDGLIWRLDATLNTEPQIEFVLMHTHADLFLRCLEHVFIRIKKKIKKERTKERKVKSFQKTIFKTETGANAGVRTLTGTG